MLEAFSDARMASLRLWLRQWMALFVTSHVYAQQHSLRAFPFTSLELLICPGLTPNESFVGVAPIHSSRSSVARIPVYG